MLIENNAKPFEVPETGTFFGTIVDVVDLGKIKTQFGEKVKIRLIWVLDKKDSEGNPFRIMRQVNASVNEKSALYEIVKGITGVAPPVPFDSETLIGRSNQLVVVKEADSKTGKVFANVKVILPLPSGIVAPVAPTGFVRSKDRQTQGQVAAPTAQAAGPTVAPIAVAQAVAQAPAPVAAASAPAPAPTAPTPAPQPVAPVVDAAF